MKRFDRFLFALFGLSLLAGCTSEVAVNAPVESSQARASADESLDGESLDAAIESAAKVRRDGDGAIIEVDLRESPSLEVLSQLPKLPKLRSVLLSGTALTDAELKNVGRISSLENLDLRGCGVTDLGLATLTDLGHLKSIKFSGSDGVTQVTDVGLEKLSALKTLKVIALDFLPISDKGLKSIAKLTELRELYLAGTKITDASASTIGSFSQLSKLRVASTAIGDAGVTQLAGLSGLVELDVSDCPGISDKALPVMLGIGKLTKLNLYSTAIGDAGWDLAAEQLPGEPPLQWLNVDKTPLTDASLATISRFQGLTFLHLGSTAVTDAGLPSLADLEKLQKLIVTRTAVTADGVKQLQSSLPQTEIQLEYVAGK
ncbi:hypothetical protein NHH03_20115 [Stieleria sp. TO1_6]|uniref:leucine-rich repeat domain-containing protein n=1 Tax=Stieleria tagensis TaxID=2956795 RepID=UPI00209B68EE|nr:hypothetical protein [Stieleria tagensis]MCO8124060.1 hypothetical protein [Stieleria tagensis]